MCLFILQGSIHGSLFDPVVQVSENFGTPMLTRASLKHAEIGLNGTFGRDSQPPINFASQAM